MGMEADTLRELLVEELKDIYDAEQQLVKALPQMAEAATFPELRQAFEHHLEETQGQVDRMKRVFKTLGVRAARKRCKGMKGLIDEGKSFLNGDGDDATRDAGLIAAAQRVEHYEIAAYGTVRTYAETLGEDEAARLLQETLDEESAANEKLNDLAITTINPSAAA